MLARPTTKPAKSDFRAPDMDAEFAEHTAKMHPIDRLACAAARLSATTALIRIVLESRSRG